mgnify:CR=1 FL=1
MVKGIKGNSSSDCVGGVSPEEEGRTEGESLDGSGVVVVVGVVVVLGWYFGDEGGVPFGVVEVDVVSRESLSVGLLAWRIVTLSLRVRVSLARVGLTGIALDGRAFQFLFLGNRIVTMPSFTVISASTTKGYTCGTSSRSSQFP